MFSGIVEESATTVSLQEVAGVMRLVVQSGLDHSLTREGDSICIDGVCLTVVERRNSELHFELAPETLRRSTLGRLVAGARVHLERSLQVGDRVHGHFVFGHVDGITHLRSRVADGECIRLEWELSKELRAYVAPKGSVSLSGTSLTVGEVTGDAFSVYIIPHTAEVTRLSTLSVGDAVNLEVDMLARYVVHACGGEPCDSSALQNSTSVNR